MHRSGHHLLVALVVAFFAALVVLVGAAPAAADPAKPTNYESIVTDIDPDSDAALFEIVGGDGFLQVVVAPGSTVIIPGYFNEPYVRIDADGSVWVNEDSPAYYINRDRYGNVSVPDDADGQGEPRWLRVGGDGRYAWHDHRVHWMSYDLPPTVSGDRRQLVWPWDIPVVVEGSGTTVAGELYFVPSLSPFAPLLVGLVALLPLAIFGWRRPLATSALVAFAAVVATGIAVAQYQATPAAARGLPVWVGFPVAALVVASGALILARSSPKRAWLLAGAGGIALLVWGLSTVDVLWLPVLPSALPAVLERSAVAGVLWTGAAVAAVSASTAFVLSRR